MEEKEYSVAFVASTPRPTGYSSFCRGGHRWPTAGRAVKITPALAKVLDRELNVKVMEYEPKGRHAGIELETEVLDLIDHSKAFITPEDMERERNIRLLEERKVLVQKQENDRLEAENEALRRGASIDAIPPAPPMKNPRARNDKSES